MEGRPRASVSVANRPIARSRGTPARARPRSSASAARTKNSGSRPAASASGPDAGLTAWTAASCPYPMEVTASRVGDVAAYRGGKAGMAGAVADDATSARWPRRWASAVIARPARPPAPKTTMLVMARR
ncbi:hypothetical protein V2I01_41070 [Micromonospora sp. BRA006-A]|nr:hypothetical protein [Micromonospora sp. BRA006-A]